MHLELQDSVGRYEIVDELGAGSMSRVYLAHDPNLDRQVALKIVLQGFSLDNREQTELERRFLLEARAAGKLSHPGIVRVYDAATDPERGIPFIAMEWVQGTSLRSLLEDQERLSGPATLDILVQVARALDYAHRAGRIHRDIKPSNILIGSDGVAKVSDFGVAKIVSESHTISGQVLGTPAYMSPEQVRDEPLDGRSDLFSLGAVLYQCVSGTTPFGGDTLVQVVYKILNVDPRPLQLPVGAAWGQLGKIVDRSLQKDPACRFQTGLEFAEAMEAVGPLLAAEPMSDFRVGGESPARCEDPETVRLSVSPNGRPAATSAPTESRTVQLSTGGIREALSGRSPAATAAASPWETRISSWSAPAAPVDGPWETVTSLQGRRSRGAALRRRTVGLGIAAAALLAAVGAVIALRFGIDPGSSVATRIAESPGQGTVDTGGSAAAREPAPSVLPESVTAAPPGLGAEADQAQSDGLAEALSEPAPSALEPRPEPLPTPLEVPPSTSSPAAPSRSTQAAGVLTPVTLLYRHKGGLAYLSVLLDGSRVWSQELKPPTKRLQKLTGYTARAVVSVPPGVHTLEVRLSDPDRSVRAVKSIRSRYTNGVKRTLRVSLDPDDNQMQLRWKE